MLSTRNTVEDLRKDLDIYDDTVDVMKPGVCCWGQKIKS